MWFTSDSRTNRLQQIRWEKTRWFNTNPMEPWKCGKPLIWDFTSADTKCQSYVASTSRRVGAAENHRENSKINKYKELEANFYFCHIAIETMDPWGDDARKLINEIGKMLNQSTGEPRPKRVFSFRELA